MANQLQGVGIGLRHAHLQQIAEDQPAVPWLEIHSENFFQPGSIASQWLDAIAKHYPISAHCVGLSLGSADGVSDAHIDQLAALIDRYNPALVSDHLSWCAAGTAATPDLLPIPYIPEAVEVFVKNIKHVQDRLRRQILVENPSSYLQFTHSTMSEWEFLAKVAERADCGLLLDVNNIYVSAHNHGFDAVEYLDALPAERVQEIHLAGYNSREIDGHTVYIDDHGAPIYDEVWALYEQALARFPNIPTLIEWDTNVPSLEVLMAEKIKAEAIITRLSEQEKAHATG